VNDLNDSDIFAYKLAKLRMLRQLHEELGDGLSDLYPWQRPPEGDWYGWAIVGGRGIGKTLGGARWLDAEMSANPGFRAGIIAPTRPDATLTCVEGETGLLKVNPAIRFNRSRGELWWPNGSRARLFGAYGPEERERMRGPQFHRMWLEEFAAWRQLDEYPRDDSPDLWQHVTLALRLGSQARFFMSSTPKRRRRFKEVIERKDVVVTRASTYDAHGLPQVVRDRLIEMYEGTRLGRQELLGEVLEDVEGALWSQQDIELNRVTAAPDLAAVIVGVDPAGSSTSGEVGICAVGVSRERWPHPRTGRPVRHMYILADVSLSAPPEKWAAAAIDLFRYLKADRMVAEPNYGGEMVQSVLKQVDVSVPLKMVHSSRGKKLRAEPIAALSAQGLVHVVGHLPKLEDEMTGWVEGMTPWSPNRLDAMVFAATELLDHVRGRGAVHTPQGTRFDIVDSTLQSRTRITR
jgi:phage terminase large subunit-like protein